MNEKQFKVKYGKDFDENIKNISKIEPDIINDIRSVIIGFYKPMFKITEQSIQHIANKYNCFKTVDTVFWRDFDVHIGYFVQNSIIHMPYKFPNLEHEVAHFIEMNDLTRLLKDDFGFNTFEYDHDKKSDINYRKIIATTIRETRVRAIQQIIQNGFIKNKDNFIKKFIYLYDNSFIVTTRQNININFGRFKSNKEFIEYLLHTVEKTFDIYNKEKILFEFENRIKYVLENSK